MAQRGTFYMIELKSENEYKAASDLAATIRMDRETEIFFSHLNAIYRDERGRYHYKHAVYILSKDTKKSRRIKKQFENMLDTMR